METIHQGQPPHPKKPEEVKADAFAEIVRSALYQIKLETPTLESFNFGNREIQITNVAGAVVALGQMSSRVAQGLYNRSLH